jgi:hypothetical protein
MTCFLAASSVSWDKAAASMLVHADLHDPILINTIGHTAGLLLFGLIVVLLIRDGRIHGVHQIKLSLFAAVLALIWNLGSLVALASTDANSFLIGIVVTVSFSVLSLLPAVLLQVALQREGRWIIAAGYTVSACAIVLHFMELFYPRLGVHQAVSDVNYFSRSYCLTKKCYRSVAVVERSSAFCLAFEKENSRAVEKWEAWCWLSTGRHFHSRCAFAV